MNKASLGVSGPFWASLGFFWPLRCLWASMGFSCLSGSRWASLSLSGPLWTSLGFPGLVWVFLSGYLWSFWASMRLSGLPWASLSILGPLWGSLGSGSLWACLSFSGQGNFVDYNSSITRLLIQIVLFSSSPTTHVLLFI